VGGTLTNFLATQRYYASKAHVSANFQTMPDLIFCSNVADNARLFDEANITMIPTVRSVCFAPSVCRLWDV
jgi:hypothetical protein